MSILRYNALAQACKKKHGHCKWWLCHTERDGPSKHCGVKFRKPSWVVDIRIDGVTLYVATCKCEGDAGLVADFARVANGREPKNFPEFWNSIKAWVAAGGNGAVPAAAPVALRGDVRVAPVEKQQRLAATVAAPLDASALAAEIKSAIAEKPDIAAEPLDPEAFWRRPVELKPDQLGRLKTAGITTVAGLALADVDKPEHVQAVSTSDRYTARKTFWSKKSAAAERLDVDIGALPAKPRKAPKQKAAKTSAKTSRKERPKAHQRVPDGVANSSIRCFSG